MPEISDPPNSYFVYSIILCSLQFSSSVSFPLPIISFNMHSNRQASLSYDNTDFVKVLWCRLYVYLLLDFEFPIYCPSRLHKCWYIFMKYNLYFQIADNTDFVKVLWYSLYVFIYYWVLNPRFIASLVCINVYFIMKCNFHPQMVEFSSEIVLFFYTYCF
jgi:hypothetical protein